MSNENHMGNKNIFIAGNSPEQVQQHQIVVNGVKRRLRIYGDGLLPVLLIGQTGIFDYVGVPKDLLKSCVFYSVDLFERVPEARIKFFTSELPKEGSNRFVEELEVVRQILQRDFAVTGKVTLMSHSAGCILGMLYAQAYPKNVKHLIFLAGSWNYTKVSAEESKRFYEADVRMMYREAFAGKSFTELSECERKLLFSNVQTAMRLIMTHPDFGNISEKEMYSAYLDLWQQQRSIEGESPEEQAFWKLEKVWRVNRFRSFVENLGIYDTLLQSSTNIITPTMGKLLSLQLARYCMFPVRNVSMTRVDRFFQAQEALEKKQKAGFKSEKDGFLAQYGASLPLYCSSNANAEDLLA